MILLRSLIYFAFMAVTIVAFGIPLILASLVLPLRYTDRWSNKWGRANLSAQRWICGLRVQVIGAEHFPQSAAIVMSKHQSAWETIALRGILMERQSWVLKKELLRIPIFGWALKIGKSIPIDRSAGRKAVFTVVEEGLKRLADDRVVVIFPEGTRTAPGERKKYGLGGALLAEKASVPVIPIAHNAGVFWKRRGVKKYPGTIQVRVGAPIETDGLKASQIMRKVEEWIEEQMLEMPTTLPEK